MTTEKKKLSMEYRLLPNNKNPEKRRLPRMDNDQWERLINLSVWKGNVLPTKLPQGINAIPQ